MQEFGKTQTRCVSGTGRGWRRLAICGLCVWGLAAGGCRSTRPEEARFAGELIRGFSPELISERTTEVFHEHSYETSHGGVTAMEFEKRAGAFNEVAYGNWVDGPVWVRVKVAIEPVDEDHPDKGYWLECHAFLLRGRGTTVEEELKLTRMRNGPYKKLLKEAAQRLKQPTPSAH